MNAFDSLPLTRKLELLQNVAEAALPHYPGMDKAAMRLVNVSENATYRVDATDGTSYALRVHREGYHSRNAIASELAWVASLRSDAAAIAPQAVPGRDGALIQIASAPGIGQRHVVMFGWEEGHEPPDTDLTAPFAVLGRIAAGMHAHTRNWRRPSNFERLTWDFAGAFGPNPHWGDWRDGMALDAERRDLFGRALALVEKRLEDFGKDPDRFGLVHCDMRLANLLLDGDTVKVIDFDDCGFSWYLYDCATALSFMEERPEVPELIASWVAGYRSAAPLSKEDEAEIPTFLMFRRLLILAWIGSHSDTDLARSLGAAYTAATVPLAERYLRDFGQK